MTTAADLEAGRPLVFRNATVLTMDDGHRVLAGADVLVTGERIAAVGPNLQVPDGTAEIDATGGIVMPGITMPPAASISAVPSGTDRAGPTASMRSPVTRTSAPVRTR